MTRAPSLVGRAVLAIGLMVGFYVLAVGIAAGLLAIPYLEWTGTNRIHVKLAVLCLVGALTVLWSILPRPDRFDAPGPLLTPKDQPRLFEDIRAVARATGQEVPHEVYLINDVNAWVARRGGVMGFFSRPVMALGLPLMQALTVSEFRAVLAHEFGHHHGGDTKLGPWIYKTRSAIGRTVTSLAEQGSWIKAPFEWYGKLFLRITLAISRNQEWAADGLAARTQGAGSLISGLKTVHGAACAFEPYWRGEAVPVLERGYRPPLASGFGQYLQAPQIAESVRKEIDRELAEGTSDPYDSHPCLKDRVAALEGTGSVSATPDSEGSAVTLLAELPRLERALLVEVAGESAIAALKPVEWDDVSDVVHVPSMVDEASEIANKLTGLTPERLPPAAEWARLGATLAGTSAENAPADVISAYAAQQVATVLTARLVDQGWSIDAGLGKPITAHLDGNAFEPFQVVHELASGEMTMEAWQERAKSLGIVGVPLGPTAS